MIQYMQCRLFCYALIEPKGLRVIAHTCMQNATHINTPSQAEHLMRWSAKIVSLCIAKCAETNMDSVGAGVTMDPRLIEKTQVVQDSAGLCKIRNARM